MKIFLLLSILIGLTFFPKLVEAHKRAKYNIVIDTDCGVDDFRALTYFMASRDCNINCITTVDGVLDPNQGANYLNELLKLYHHEGIPLGEGEKHKASKEYSSHALSMWAKLFPINVKAEFKPALDVLSAAIKSENKRTIIIALGPLSNIVELFEKNPELILKVDMVLWYSEFEKIPIGYNHNQSPEAYDKIISMKIPVKIMDGSGLKYSATFLDFVSEINSVYSKAIRMFFKDFDKSMMYYWDDFIPLYLSFPNMFEESVVSELSRTIKPKPECLYEVLITSILNSNKPDIGVVFNELPTEGLMLIQDVNNISSQLIEKHGYMEFKITSLTSEIHSHMGIYSILGAKMGLRMIEYLHAGLDEIEIVSYAGSMPPISCLNDGLQVGTGSTIGYGTITVENTDKPIPSAIVIYNGRKIRFSVKEEITNQINSDVGKLIKDYGLDSEMYWIKLREISLQYWLNISRFDAFEIEEIESD